MLLHCRVLHPSSRAPLLTLHFYNRAIPTSANPERITYPEKARPSESRPHYDAPEERKPSPSGDPSKTQTDPNGMWSSVSLGLVFSFRFNDVYSSQVVYGVELIFNFFYSRWWFNCYFSYHYFFYCFLIVTHYPQLFFANSSFLFHKMLWYIVGC